MEDTLEELGFDMRACNLLKRPPHNIITLGDLLAHSREELRDIHKFGDKSLTKVEERLKELGYEMAPSRKKA